MKDGTDEARPPEQFDAVVIGAGFAGLYMLHRLRGEGLSAIVFEAGTDVGGTWYWNRYPGARCDVESVDYVYSFDPELAQDWDWDELYPAQPDVLRYLQHVADRYDLRTDIVFETRVEQAHFDEAAGTWRVVTDTGRKVEARFVITAVGCLSEPNYPDLPGLEDFEGELYHTARWPKHEVTFEGKHVGVIGTGSSGIQAIPAIAQTADQLTVFQRTPSYSVPARNRQLTEEELEQARDRFVEYKAEARYTKAGLVQAHMTDKGAEEATPEERQQVYMDAWQRGGPLFVRGTFNNLLFSLEANTTAADFLRERIDEIVDDPEVAETLKPYSYPIGAKRICVDTDYYRTYNRDNVELVDVASSPITRFTEHGIETTEGGFDLDMIVLATGFDAMTGALLRIDIRGRDDVQLRELWQDGPEAYLGLQVHGFPNLFTITGPQSPSVLSNMVISIEQHVDWITDCILHLREQGHDLVEPELDAQSEWADHSRELGEQTLYRLAKSWYVGANIPGKKRVFMPYVGGVGEYRRICEDVVADGYRGFRFGTIDDGQVVWRPSPSAARPATSHRTKERAAAWIPVATT